MLCEHLHRLHTYQFFPYTVHWRDPWREAGRATGPRADQWRACIDSVASGFNHLPSLNYGKQDHSYHTHETKPAHRPASLLLTTCCCVLTGWQQHKTLTGHCHVLMGWHWLQTLTGYCHILPIKFIKHCQVTVTSIKDRHLIAMCWWADTTIQYWYVTVMCVYREFVPPYSYLRILREQHRSQKCDNGGTTITH